MINMIKEAVYADKKKINRNKKIIGLTYSKGKSQDIANSGDKLVTTKMDSNDSSTYEVPLKGGLISYNITNIKGIEIMHYFKRKWDQKNTELKVANNGSIDKYKLTMDNQEEEDFFKQFVQKVQKVVEEWINKNKKQDVEFSKISILPVDSTSNFNKSFVQYYLANMHINGLNCQMIDPKIIIKDVKNIKLDSNFIDNNKDFFNGNYAVNKPDKGTVIQTGINAINKNKALQSLHSKINEINKIREELIDLLNNKKKLSKKEEDNIALKYKSYYDLINQCFSIKWNDVINNKDTKFTSESVMTQITNSGDKKNIDEKSKKLNTILDKYFKKNIKRYTLHQWKPTNFQIKTLKNSTRMSLRDMYSVNSEMDEQKLQEEINKIKGTILLIFDDNVSGGATLSDVCYQLKDLGIQNIIPITFGKMAESNREYTYSLSSPDGGYNLSTDNNLSLNQDNNIKSIQKKDKLKNDVNINMETSSVNGTKAFYKKYPQLLKKRKKINILWLDDQREPYKYFASNRPGVLAWELTTDYYNNNIFNKYNPNFIWVKTLKEFQEYILNNGMPDMISFDRDLKSKIPNLGWDGESGEDVAKWLNKYCQKNGITRPLTFVHSANPKGQVNIKNILNNNITENKVIKLTEKQFKDIIKESVINIIKNNIII